CTPATVFGLDVSGLKLLRFDSATPGTIAATIPINGLAVGGATETIVGLDFRASTGRLFALGHSETAAGDAAGRIITLNAATGAATLVGTGALTAPLDDDAKAYGFDFNPLADRIRIVNDADQNLRVNPNDATVVVDGNLAFAAGDVSNGSPDVSAVAY